MATLSITKNYNDGEVLLEADLDEIVGDVETFLNTTKINDDNIQASGITGSTKILAGSINAANLASDSVTTAKILAVNVTQAKIALLAVDNAQMAVGAAIANIATGGIATAKLADLAVTTAKIDDLAVTTGKIAAAAVTPAKRSTAVTAQASTSSATGVTTSASLACTITANSRPVLITLSACDYWQSSRTTKLYRAGSALATIYIGDNVTTENLQSWVYLDTTGASGSTQYDIRTDAGTAGPRSGAGLFLSVMEL